MRQLRAVFRAFRYPDFFWFWWSYFLSNIGSWMQAVAQAWLLYELTESPLILGVFSLIRSSLLLAFFFSGGLMADRWDRRLLMIWIQIISLLSALALGMLTSLAVVQVWHIMALGAINSTVWAFEQPVRHSLIPQLVERDDLPNAIALNAIVWQGAGLLGPSLVGLLVDWIGIDGCFYINALSYLCVVGALMRMHIPPVTGAGGRGLAQSITDGFTYICREKLIYVLLISTSLFNVFGRSYLTLLPVIAKDVLKVGASGLGFISAAPGLGTIIGSLAVAALARGEVRRNVLVFLLVGYASSLVLFTSTGHLQTAFAILVVVGALSIAFDTLVNTVIQLTVDDAYRGRVMGVHGMASAGLREFGGVQAGALAEWLSAGFAINAGAVVVALFALFYLAPRLRRFSKR
ncbi:MAG TPA: MFS transporter [Candidatus Acidoferrales bacterium]|nr:MFS transporter [Candidatus Acidoferrales bacterium]